MACAISRIRPNNVYRGVREPIDILMKVETHNHPDRDLAVSRRGDRLGR